MLRARSDVAVPFWKRPEANANTTETQNVHDKIQGNKYFLNELQKNRNEILKYMDTCSDNTNDLDTHHIMDLFEKWIHIAFKYSPSFIKHANAVCLSTIDEHGYPSSRYVLLKSIEKKSGQFIFFTNYGSNKAVQIENISNHASMTLYWDILDLSIRIKGNISRVNEDLSNAYWRTRPKQSKLSAITSKQSQIIWSRTELQNRLETYQKQYRNIKSEDIQRPMNWGGFALHAQSIEFWIGYPHRFHERIVFTKQNANKWNVQRLQP